MPRSRRGANTLAQDLLLKPTIGDDEVVAVLWKLYFGRNKIRTNVFPEGATSVHSDDTRTGAVARRACYGVAHDHQEQ